MDRHTTHTHSHAARSLVHVKTILRHLVHVTHLHVNIPTSPGLIPYDPINDEDVARAEAANPGCVKATRVLLLPDLIPASRVANRFTAIDFHDTYNPRFMWSVTRFGLDGIPTPRLPRRHVHVVSVLPCLGYGERIWCPRTRSWVNPGA